MALTVNTNVPSLNAQRNVGINNSALAKSLERLSSGLRINKAADDAAGLAIATKLDAQIGGFNQAVRNANNAVSLVQTAESGVNTLTNILQRLRELAVQSASDDNTPSDRAATEQEAQSLIGEFTRIATTIQFNTMNLLDGSFTGKYFQIGANYGQTVTLSIGDARARSLGGRAEYTASLAGGVATATNANFGAGEIKMNGLDVGPTNSADDQYSVLDISSHAPGADLLSTNVSAATTLSFLINNTAVNVTLAVSTAITADQLATSIANAINQASITGVNAFTVNGSQWVLEATGGTNLNLQYSYNYTGTASGLFSVGGQVIGMTGALSGMFGNSLIGTVGNYNGESSAIAKAVAINAIQGLSKVLATAQKNVVTGTGAVASSGTFNLSSGDVYINGVDIGAVTVLGNDSTGALAMAVNNVTGTTGVGASVDANGKLVLTAADGRNIAITTRTAAIGNNMGLLSADATNNTWLYRSDVKLNDKENFTVTSPSSLFDLTGMTETSRTVAADVSTYNVAHVKLDTLDNAQAAILTVDSALDEVNGIRAGIGAVQNKLEFTVNNLQIASENMSASKSRIKDVDFAVEVATFTRNQIMVQAGVAMVAQANATSQYALQLLK
jgi:flagellin